MSLVFCGTHTLRTALFLGRKFFFNHASPAVIVLLLHIPIAPLEPSHGLVHGFPAAIALFSSPNLGSGPVRDAGFDKSHPAFSKLMKKKSGRKRDTHTHSFLQKCVFPQRFCGLRARASPRAQFQKDGKQMSKITKLSVWGLVGKQGCDMSLRYIFVYTLSETSPQHSAFPRFFSFFCRPRFDRTLRQSFHLFEIVPNCPAIKGTPIKQHRRGTMGFFLGSPTPRSFDNHALNRAKITPGRQCGQRL